jgi:hypothetical protein
MKLKIKMFAFFAGILALSSCTSESENGFDSGDSLLRITASIQSRSVISSTSFTQGDQIGVFALNAQGKGYNSTSMNMRAVYNTQWTFPDGTLHLTSDDAVVYAYYPYASDCDTTGVNINITPTATGQTDYLYGKSESSVNKTNLNANIHFQHALARITLSLTRDANDKGKGILNDVALRNASGSTAISVSGKLDFKSGKIKAIPNVNASIGLSIDDTLDSSTPKTVDLLVIPTEADSLNLVLNIDDSPYFVKVSNIKWEAGKQYTYPITINRASIHHTGLQVGNYYYSDGTWGTSTQPLNKTVVGVVFSTLPSSTDKNNGWTHGYALALQNGDSNAAWAIIFGKEPLDYMNTSSLMVNDKDGYSHTQVLKNGRLFGSSTDADFHMYYPAFYEAIHYSVAAPSSSSGWYLPSIGQWNDVLDSLVTINKCLEAVKSATVSVDDIGSTDWFYSSSQYDSDQACIMDHLSLAFRNKNVIGVNGIAVKNRSVIAF